MVVCLTSCQFKFILQINLSVFLIHIIKNNWKAARKPKSGEISAELDMESFKKFIKTAPHKYLTAQNRLCFAVIARMYRRVLNDNYFGDIKVDGNMVVEGNHRFIAYTLAGIEFEIIAGTRSHCDKIKKFNDIEIDLDHDWDLNDPSKRLFCTDDFLRDGKFLRK
jgi:hypothetical protein